MTIDTLQQRMAITGYEKVEAFRNQHPSDSGIDEAARKKYGTMAHKLPILIHTAGLTQALAFVQSRGSGEQRLLLDHVAVALQLPGITTGDQLATRSREAELPEYMLLTRRTLAALVWYKRFAESVLKVGQGDQDEDDGPVATSEAESPVEVANE